jgi:hypothetical protein
MAGLDERGWRAYHSGLLSCHFDGSLCSEPAARDSYLHHRLVLLTIGWRGCQGYDLALISAVKRAVTIPVIASSGAGKAEHFSQASDGAWRILDRLLAASGGVVTDAQQFVAYCT